MGKPRKEQNDLDYPGGTTKAPSLPYDHPKKRQIVNEPPMEVGRNLKMKKIKNELNNLFSENRKEKVLDLEEVYSFVDRVLDEKCGGSHGKKKKVSENEENSLPSGRRPYDDPEDQMMALKKDIGEALRSFNEAGEKNGEAYQKFFKSMLKRYGVTSPDQLSDEKKKEFFNKIEYTWDEEKDK